MPPQEKSFSPIATINAVHTFIAQSVIVQTLASAALAAWQPFAGKSERLPFRGAFVEHFKSRIGWTTAAIAGAFGAYDSYRRTRRIYEHANQSCEERDVLKALLKQQGTEVYSYRRMDSPNQQTHVAKLEADAASSAADSTIPR